MTHMIQDHVAQILSTVARHEWENIPRKHRWIKEIRQIHEHCNPLTALDGSLLARGHIKVALQPTLYLVKSEPGGRLPRDPQYHIVVMDSAGGLRILDDPHLPNPGYPYTQDTIDELTVLLKELQGPPPPHPSTGTLSLQRRQAVIEDIAKLPTKQRLEMITYTLENLDNGIDSDAFEAMLEELIYAIDIRLTTGMW